MSSEFQTVLFIFILPVCVFASHVLTHLTTARAVSPVSISCESYIPFRLRLNFHQTPSRLVIRVIALAPTLVGVATAVIFVQTGIWEVIRDLEPYYLHYILAANWLFYTTPSPADFRTAVSPPTDDDASTSTGST